VLLETAGRTAAVAKPRYTKATSDEETRMVTGFRASKKQRAMWLETLEVLRRQISNGAEATANMGEPSEREALLTILLSMLARECLTVISLWGAKELVITSYKAGFI
jgi:hypothetical protein